MKENINVLRSFSAGSDNPSVTPKFGKAGDVYVKKSATRSIFIKEDDGSSTNWTNIVQGLLSLNRVTVISPQADTTNTFTTLQEAFDSIPAATTAAEARQVYTVLVPSGIYDEDVVVELNNRKIMMVVLGSASLGVMSGASWGTGGTARNFTINVAGAPATIDGIRSGFVMTSLDSGTDGFSTHESYLSKFRISGNLVLSSTIGTSSEFSLETEVFGNLDASGYVGNCNFYCRRSRFRGTFGGAALRLQLAERSRFTGLATVNNYSMVDRCLIEGGMTITANASEVLPVGFINCDMSGTYTSPANGIRLDAYSNYWFKTNGAVLGGAATKVILGDLVP